MIDRSKAVCYVDNGSNSLAYFKVAWRVIERCGLVPFTYANFTQAMCQSNQDQEVRDNFYGAKIAAVRLDGDPAKIADHWVIPEFEKAWDKDFFVKRSEALLVYVNEPVAVDILEKYHLPPSIRVVSNQDDFAVRFEADLRALLH